MREQADDSVAKLLISSQFEPMNPSDRMHITMVKKLLEGGRACDKCLQAEQLLRDRGLWDKVNEVLWAVEGDANSQGMLIAADKGIKLAPFFIVKNDNGTERT